MIQYIPLDNDTIAVNPHLVSAIAKRVDADGKVIGTTIYFTGGNDDLMNVAEDFHTVRRKLQNATA